VDGIEAKAGATITRFSTLVPLRHATGTRGPRRSHERTGAMPGVPGSP
jgi:hypothetical protein